MATKQVDYHNYREDAEALLAICRSDKVLVVFTANDDPETGLPWCPDCVRAVPVVVAFAAEKQLPLLQVQVGQRAEWKTPSHPLKSDLYLPVLCVPTVALLNKDLQAIGPVYGRELEHARGSDEIAEILEGLLQTAEKSAHS